MVTVPYPPHRDRDGNLHHDGWKRQPMARQARVVSTYDQSWIADYFAVAGAAPSLSFLLRPPGPIAREHRRPTSQGNYVGALLGVRTVGPPGEGSFTEIHRVSTRAVPPSFMAELAEQRRLGRIDPRYADVVQKLYDNGQLYERTILDIRAASNQLDRIAAEFPQYRDDAYAAARRVRDPRPVEQRIDWRPLVSRIAETVWPHRIHARTTMALTGQTHGVVIGGQYEVNAPGTNAWVSQSMYSVPSPVSGEQGNVGIIKSRQRAMGHIDEALMFHNTPSKSVQAGLLTRLAEDGLAPGNGRETEAPHLATQLWYEAYYYEANVMEKLDTLCRVVPGLAATLEVSLRFDPLDAVPNGGVDVADVMESWLRIDGARATKLVDGRPIVQLEAVGTFSEGKVYDPTTRMEVADLPKAPPPVSL